MLQLCYQYVLALVEEYLMENRDNTTLETRWRWSSSVQRLW